MQKPAITLMIKAARAAGNVLLRHMHKLDALNVVEKGRMDFASEVDTQAGLKPWDIAAGALLVREAGGKVVDFRGRPTGPMDNRGLAGRPLVAGNLKVCDELQKRIVDTGYAAAFDAA